MSHLSFKSVFFILHIFYNFYSLFWCWFLVLFHLIEEIISIFLYFLRLSLWSKIWFFRKFHKLLRIVYIL
jgi:hypothetical protein